MGALPTPAELDYMAYHRQSARVHGIFRILPREERARYASDAVLTEVVMGGLRRLRAAPAAATRLQQEEREFPEEVLRLFIDSCQRRSVYPRELFRCLLDWCEHCLAGALLSQALWSCDTALRLGGSSFPDLYPRLVLLKAEIVAARGGLEEAHALLWGLYRRLDLVSSRAVVADLVLALARSAALTGRPALFKRVLFDGLWAFHTGLAARREMVALLRRVHGGTLGVLASGEPAADRLLFAAHWICLAVRPLLRSRAVAHPFERGLLGLVYVLRYAMPGARPPRPAAGPGGERVLVTRAMGGIGDLLMMTPGLHARRLRSGARVDLAIPRRFFPVFQGNDDVNLLDIAQDLDPRGYDRWYNLTDCPAARMESRSAPRVRRTRIDMFARGLGVPGAWRRRMDRRPRYVLTAEDRAFQARHFAAHGLDGRPVVGVQLRADESYRDYAHMAALVAVLAREHPVLLFDSQPIPGFDLPGVVKVDGHGLREAFALAAGCRVLVAPDSSFVHLSAALGVPCVALFGPTHGRVRTRDYPLARTLDAAGDLRCVPCWRNEEIPCALTGMRASACMEAVPVEAVTAAVREMLAG
jgi:hypothetical protein